MGDQFEALRNAANRCTRINAEVALLCESALSAADVGRALLAERDQLRARVHELGAMARENRSRAVVELEAEMDKLRADLERTERNHDLQQKRLRHLGKHSQARRQQSIL